MATRRRLGVRTFALLITIGVAIAGLLVAAGVQFSRNQLATHGFAEGRQAVPSKSLVSAELETVRGQLIREEEPEATSGVGTSTDLASPAPASRVSGRDSPETAEFDASPPGPLPTLAPHASGTTVSASAEEQTYASSDAFDDSPDDALGELSSIAGYVRDEAGLPIPGVELTATAIRLFEIGEKPASGSAAVTHYAVTDFAGWYEFWDLADGEYRVQIASTGEFAAAQKTFRAGVRSADFVLSWQEEVTVFGVVRGAEGEPLDEVRVTGPGSPPRVAYTDAHGRYELTLTYLTRTPVYLLHFKRAGYRDQRLQVDSAERGGDLWSNAQNVTMAPVGALATVKGSLRDPGGRPVVGEAVRLASRGLQRGYQGVSDEVGRFSIPGVEPAADYRVLVAARGPYRDYRRSRINVEARGLVLNIVLEPLVLGRIEGRMVDLDGDPIPRYSLTLKSEVAVHHSVQVTGDDAGFFIVTGVPEGPVKLRTESVPRLIVTGIRASQDSREPVPVMLDLGNHELRGWVVDGYGDPVASAAVNIRMEHIKKGVRSFSARDAVSDVEGYFEFSGLGRGIHTVRASRPGSGTTELDTEVGVDAAELVIELAQNQEDES